MRKLFLVLVLTVVLAKVFAQEDATIRKIQKEVSQTIKKDIADTTAWTTKKGGLINVNLTQGSLTNWAAGGDKFSFAVNSHVNFFRFQKKEKQNWDNNLDFYLGLIQSTSLGSRKNDDRFDFLSKYGYNFDGHWFVSGLYNFRTQFFDGYTYADDKRTFSSTLLSPAYMLTSVGLDYKPNEDLSIFISPITSRMVIVGDDYLSDRGAYGVDSTEHINNEVGAFSSINYKTGFYKNISYKGRLDLFSNYRRHADNIDVFMTNYFAFKINKFFSATYNLDMIYDDDVKLFGDNGDSPALQVKSLVGIGFLMKF